MANRIQIRRDHSTNWTRINPVLSDGEPGLEIDTNKVKYGDGTTAWRDLSYAITGFRYANIQEGDIGHLVTSITGIPDDGISITSDNFAQLMWVPDTNTVTLADIYGNGGAPTFSWAYVDDTGFNVENKQPGTDFNWQFNFDGTTEFPHYTFPASDGSANQVLKTDGNGTLSWTNMSGGGAANGWQLTSGTAVVNLASNGVLTLSTASTILGNSSDPNVYIETATTSSTSTWTFGTNGVLTLPADTPIIQGGGTGTDVTVIATTGTNTAIWVFSADGSTSFPNPINGTKSQIYTTNLGLQTVFETWSSAQGDGQKLVLDRDNASVQIQSLPGKQWTFAQDGTLTLPLDNKIKGIHIAPAGQILTTGVEAYTSDLGGNTYSWHYADDPVFTTALNNNFLLTGNKVFPVGHPEQAVTILGTGGGDDIPVAFDGPLGAGPYTVVTADYVLEQWAPVTIESNTATWVFGTDGSLTLPGLMTLPVSTSTPAISTSTGTVAICDGVGWNGGGDGLQHLMVYINGSWTKVV
jgi:Major tropism determinant N-terminal domain